MKRGLVLIGVVGWALSAAGACLAAQASDPSSGATPAAAPAPADYADGASWLCRPGRSDVCSRADEDATIVREDGSTTLERFHPEADPPVDCFYVYPTVSRDHAGNASMAIEPEEVQVVEQQFARFASKCRLFAPVYRQVTLMALQAAMLGRPMPADRALAYTDVADAWAYYLAHDNHGRGVVLIGHSQGSGVLIELVKKNIDGQPVQGRILSVILGGARLQVPVGKDVGGDFKSIPLCHDARQIGCAVNFASFRADSPPPSNARFGASSGPGLEAACVNPAALGGGTGALKAYLASGAQAIVASSQLKIPPWTNPPTAIQTPFVETPGLLSAECVNDGTHNYLAITLHPDPAGHRVNTIVGDVMVGGLILKDWGLHLIDMNLTMGNLVDLVGAQSAAYQLKRQ
jgi:hypothetical protein